MLSGEIKFIEDIEEQWLTKRKITIIIEQIIYSYNHAIISLYFYPIFTTVQKYRFIWHFHPVISGKLVLLPALSGCK